MAGLTEGAERSLVARLAPVRTGSGFGVYHALTGLAALPAGLGFGALYQNRGGGQALLASGNRDGRRDRRVAGGHRETHWRGGPLRHALAALAVIGLVAPVSSGSAQVLIRVGEPGRATYSELHEGLQAGTPAADSVRALLAEKEPRKLWRRMQAAVKGSAPWNDAPLALTRLAELRSPAYADSAARLAARIEAGKVTAPPGQDPADLLAPLRAVQLERARAVRGDAAVLKELLALIPEGRYGVGDAWVLGRLGRAASDSLQARFLAAKDVEPKVRYLTLLTFSDDTQRDSAAGPRVRRARQLRRAAALSGRARPTRCSGSARDRASRRCSMRGSERVSPSSYADPSLSRGGYDFLANDSSAVISRTGKWLTEWLKELK